METMAKTDLLETTWTRIDKGDGSEEYCSETEIRRVCIRDGVRFEDINSLGVHENPFARYENRDRDI